MEDKRSHETLSTMELAERISKTLKGTNFPLAMTALCQVLASGISQLPPEGWDEARAMVERHLASTLKAIKEKRAQTQAS